MRELEKDGVAFISGRWPLDPARNTLVFIHGAGGSSVLWRAQVESLAERVNTVALDLPGHGASKGPGRDRVPDYARVVLEFLDAIGAPGPIPCGLSMGGAIAQQLLLDHVRRFPAGILVSTGARLKVMPLILETIRSNYPEYVNSFRAFAASARTPPERLQALLEDAARCDPQVAYGDFLACDAFDVADRLPGIGVPVLVVTASDDKLTPPKYGAFLAGAIRTAEPAHIEDAGHVVPAEKPEELHRAVLGFLDRHGL